MVTPVSERGPQLRRLEREPVATLETERLLLREWRDDDVPAWVALNADPRVMEFFPSLYDRARAEASAIRIRQRLVERGYGLWAVEVKGGVPFAGFIGLQPVPFEAAFTPALEIGWRLAFEVWGCGYATEGASAALGFAFSALAAAEVVAMTAAPNERSQRVMRKLGMRYDPRDDFDHPALEDGHPLRRHVLYRIARAAPLS